MKNKQLCLVLASVFAMSLLLFALPAPALALDITVAPGDSVQDAINSASPGNTIILEAGLYPENIAVSKPLTIRGAGSGTVLGSVTVFAPEVTIENLTITSDHIYDIHVDYEEINDYLDANLLTVNTLTFRNVILEGTGGNTTGIRIASNSVENIEDAVITIDNCIIRNYRSGIRFDSQVDSIFTSTINIIGNTINNIADFAIVFDSDQVIDSSVNITNNNITSNTDHAVAFYSQVVFGSIVSIEGNEIVSNTSDGISFRGAVDGGNIIVESNTISAGDNAVYLYLTPGSTTTVSNNTISATDYGVAVERLVDATDDPTQLYILNNRVLGMTSDAISLGTTINMNDPDSLLVIAGNSFRDNSWSIYIPAEVVMTDPTQLVIMANSFTGSDTYSLYSNDANVSTIAIYNWWGTPDGPTTDPAGEERVTANVHFDPWLATLVITPGNDTKTTGTNASFAVTLLDNQGEAVAADGLLYVRFTVSGTNTTTQVVPLHDSATFAYTSNAAGNDTVTAVVLFAGEATGLETQATLAWTASADLPATGGNIYFLILSGLVMILAGGFILRKIVQAV